MEGGKTEEDEKFSNEIDGTREGDIAEREKEEEGRGERKMGDKAAEVEEIPSGEAIIKGTNEKEETTRDETVAEHEKEGTLDGKSGPREETKNDEIHVADGTVSNDFFQIDLP